ncbi:MAG: energy-coupling factor transporter ATPase [Clostridia bacterium]|nr:energy-coupling factor transporter ATPase [Clostridia bacterium]
MGDVFIKTEGLCFSYDDDEDRAGKSAPVIKGLDIEIKRGSFVAVLGHNGSGKSTLAKLLNLVLVPTSGKIWIDGTEITEDSLTEDQLYEIRRRVGMVFQNPDNQLVATVVEEDVAFGPENLGVEPSEIRRRVDWALETVGMREFAKHSPAQLSGGQKQRVAIAGIIAMMPECIIFDESTAMLDPGGRKEVMDTIERLNRENGITVLHITHNMDEAVRADRVVVISDGRLILDGTPLEVFSNVGELRKVGLDVPQVTELLYELYEAGYDVPTGILDENGCADALCEILRKAADAE